MYKENSTACENSLLEFDEELYESKVNISERRDLDDGKAKESLCGRDIGEGRSEKSFSRDEPEWTCSDKVRDEDE